MTDAEKLIHLTEMARHAMENKEDGSVAIGKLNLAIDKINYAHRRCVGYEHLPELAAQYQSHLDEALQDAAVMAMVTYLTLAKQTKP